MSARSIICLFNGLDYERTALETAIALTRHEGGHLRVVHVVYLAQSYSGFFGEAVVVGGGWQEAIDRQNEERLETARAITAELCARHDLPLDVRGSRDHPRASFVPMENALDSTFVRELSLCDLIVIGAEEGSAAVIDQSAADLAMFSTGRPVLIVRPGGTASPAPIAGETCAIAWNNTPEAIRAVINARPLWRGARQTHLLVAPDGRKPAPTQDQTKALEYLAAHGVDAQFHVVDRGQRPAAEAVLTRARELGSAYIVMGAFGHSVFRERLLGGFSEYMLETCELPLLMSH